MSSSSENSSLDLDKLIELIESGIIGIGLIALAIIKLISFLEKRKTNRAQIELMRSQAAFNNMIPVRCEIESLDESGNNSY